MRLTSVNCLWCHLCLGACVVLSICLFVDACLGAVGVEVAVVVHSRLESISLPAENIITMCSRATVEKISRHVKS